MAEIRVTDRSGEEHVIDGRIGSTVMENIKRAGIADLAAICGGCCSCATCHVHVAPEWLDKLPAQEEDEYDLVSDAESYQDNSRLSCQIKFTPDLDGLAVTIAPED